MITDKILWTIPHTAPGFGLPKAALVFQTPWWAAVVLAILPAVLCKYIVARGQCGLYKWIKDKRLIKIFYFKLPVQTLLLILKGEGPRAHGNIIALSTNYIVVWYQQRRSRGGQSSSSNLVARHPPPPSPTPRRTAPHRLPWSCSNSEERATTTGHQQPVPSSSSTTIIGSHRHRR